jgi:hypothetical protein
MVISAMPSNARVVAAFVPLHWDQPVSKDLFLVYTDSMLLDADCLGEAPGTGSSGSIYAIFSWAVCCHLILGLDPESQHYAPSKVAATSILSTGIVGW